MREDHQEALDRMFPRGYVIVYTFEHSDDMRCHYYNPEGYESITKFKDIINKADKYE